MIYKNTVKVALVYVSVAAVEALETIELCQIGFYFDFLLCFILGNPLTVSGSVHYTRFF